MERKKKKKKPKAKPAKPHAKRTGPVRSREIKKIQAKILKKRRLLFRGRFGKRSVRRKSREKWSKWRKPRGIDIQFKREDGNRPSPGYRTPVSIRFRHPSGYKEELVRNSGELLKASKLGDTAIRIAGTVGKRKRIELIKKADELKLLVLNR